MHTNFSMIILKTIAEARNKKASHLRGFRGAEWIRTTDSRIFSPMLYQLSYSTLNWRHKSMQKVNSYKTFSINSELH